MATALHHLTPEILFSRRAHKRHMTRAAKAFSAISLGAAFAFTASEAAAQTARASTDNAFTAIDGTPLGFTEDGDLRVMLASGEEMIIPRGEYGLVGDQIMVSDLIDGVEVAQNGYIPPTSGAYPTYSSPGFFGGLGYGGILIPVGLVAAGIIAYIVITRSNNTAPEFAAASFSENFDENDTGTVVAAPATDAEKDTITYTLSGVDAGAFTVDSSGNISFTSKPNEEAPGDAGRDNVYNLSITATDDHGEASSALVTITVIDDDADYQTDATATLTSLSAGNDDVTASGAITDFDAGAGNDAVNITGTMSGTGDMGTGNDHLTVSNDLGSAATFDMGAGNDWFELDGGTQAANITVDLGTGADVVDIDAAIAGTTAKLDIEAMSSDDIIDLRELTLSENVNTTVYADLATAMAELDDYDVVFWDNGADLQMVIDVDEDDDVTVTGDADDMFIDLIGIQSVSATMFDLA